MRKTAALVPRVTWTTNPLAQRHSCPGAVLRCEPASRQRLQPVHATGGNEPNRAGKLPARSALQGSTNWKGLLPPYTPGDQLQEVFNPAKGKRILLDSELRSQLIMYGELAQVTYDTFISDVNSARFGTTLYRPKDIFKNCLQKGSKAHKYTIPATNDSDENFFLYSTGGAYRLDESNKYSKVENAAEKQWLDKDGKAKRNWIGYVCVSDPDPVTELRDIAIAFRGSITTDEWITDFTDILKPWDPNGTGNLADGCVHLGFQDAYCGSAEDGPRQTVHAAVSKLLEQYKGKVGSITTTGHSLGAALATVCAFDVAEFLKSNYSESGVVVTAITFASPRVGNPAFSDAVDRLGLKVLRVVNWQDVVPTVPGLLQTAAVKTVQQETEASWASWLRPWLASSLAFINSKLSNVPVVSLWTYTHVGVPLMLSITMVGDCKGIPVLRTTKRTDLGGFHNLEVYLYMIATQHTGPGSPALDRPIRLINKGCDMLHPGQGVPSVWWVPLQSQYYHVQANENGWAS